MASHCCEREHVVIVVVPVYLKRCADENYMLLWQSYKVGTVDYESLGYAIGGPVWKVPFPKSCCPWLRKQEPSLQCVLLPTPQQSTTFSILTIPRPSRPRELTAPCDGV